ncbi:MAG: MoaD/ThiS family protein, partial [Candidatus Korarchaeum sp.]
MPRVRVRFYAFYRELSGTDELSLELPEGSMVSDLLRAIEERFDGFKGKLLNRKIGTRSYILVRRG